MAENKKSFIAYADWVSVFNMLTDEEAGKLVKLIFSYVNDENPEVQDRVLKMAFEPIKSQLKRDLSKWVEIKEKRREAGRKGAEAKAEQNKQMLANADFAEQTLAKQAVNVNVNVNDNVNDNVNGSVVYNISDTTHNLGLGIDYRKSYDSMNDEFKKLYEREVYNSYIDLMKKLHVECRFLAQWENQLTIYEFKKIYDRIISKEITSSEVRQALIDLAANKQAKDKFNSVAHGSNIYLKTIINRR